jgi:uncharacterized protein (DUF2141 family)
LKLAAVLLASIALLAPLLASSPASAQPLRSTPDLGKAEAQCRPGETGPAFMVEVAGLKDRQGKLKLEVYPANDTDFLADDNILINAGKTFRRVELPVPGDPAPKLCVRVPGPGTYAVTVLHDRNADRKFNFMLDGIGFSANPKLGLSKPKSRAVAVSAGSGLTPVRVVMNYRTGLFSFGPLKQAR